MSLAPVAGRALVALLAQVALLALLVAVSAGQPASPIREVAATAGPDGAVGGAPAANGPAGGTHRVATLTILHTNDTHSNLLPLDMAGIGSDAGGIARRAVLIETIRREASHTMLLDAGDIFQGTAFYGFFKGEADLLAFSLCGYEATTLGNHELDDGLEHLRAQFSRTAFPLVCANIVTASDGAPVFPTHLTLDRAGWRWGVIGAIGSEAWSVIPWRYREGMRFLDPLPTVASLARALRAAGAQGIIVLSHSGYDEDLQMTPHWPMVDVVIGGHTNHFLHRPELIANGAVNGLGGTLVVQAGKNGVRLGRLDLALDLASPGRILGYHGQLLPIDGRLIVPRHHPVARVVEVFESLIAERTRQVMGENQTALEYPEGEKHLRDLPLGRVVGEALLGIAGADLAILNSGTIRRPLPAGPITMGDILATLPFDNTIVTYRIPGHRVAAMLDFIAARHGDITGYQYAGVSAVLRKSAGRAEGIRIGGRPLVASSTYLLVTTSYLADGNQYGNELFRGATFERDLGFQLRDAMIEHLRRHRPLRPPPADQIRFEP